MARVGPQRHKKSLSLSFMEPVPDELLTLPFRVYG